jgi:hypothetical protein
MPHGVNGGDTPPLGPTSLFVGLGLAGFVVVAALIHPFVPWPEEKAMRAKYEHFAAHKDEFDAVYIGSSRVLRGIDPKVIDADIEAGVETGGRPFRSFNFGLAGMMTLESDFVLRELLALSPARLRYVLFEANTWYGGFDDPWADPHSLRNVYWHTVPQTAKALETLRLSDKPRWERLKLAGTHIETMVWKLVNYGQGARIWSTLRGTDAAAINEEIPVDEIAEGRGYQPLEALTDEYHKFNRTEFLASQDKYKAMIDAIPATNAKATTLATYNFEALRSQQELVRSHGMELIYVVLPSMRGSPDPGALLAGNHVPVLFHFNQPEKYPSLFEMDRLQDAWHPSRLGTKEVSDLIARSLAAEMKRAGEKTQESPHREQKQ